MRVLSRLFRRLFLEELRAPHDEGRLGFFGDLAHLAKPDAFGRLLTAKPPFGGPEQVLAYLGRYTHPRRDHQFPADQHDRRSHRFRWRDYRHRGKTKLMTAGRARVHPPLSPAHSARRLPSHPPLASSPTAIAPPSSNCAAGCWPARDRTLSNRMPKLPLSPPNSLRQRIAAHAAEGR
nr:transposase [Mesorhizobium sp. WSM2561]